MQMPFAVNGDTSMGEPALGLFETSKKSGLCPGLSFNCGRGQGADLNQVALGRLPGSRVNQVMGPGAI